MLPRRDHLVRTLIHGPEVRVLTAFTTDTARAASASHGCAPTSAALLAQGLTAGVLLASSLEKEKARITLQLACDGPAGGMLVDAGADGTVRGYVRNPKVYFPASPGEPLHPEQAIGRSGYLNVLRDLGGQDVYRGLVELSAFDLGGDLRNYLLNSEQIESAVALLVLPDAAGGGSTPDAEPLGTVAGVVLQCLPGGDPAAVQRAQAALEDGALERGLRAQLSAVALVQSLGFGGAATEIEVLADYPVVWTCSCSQERVVRAVLTLGLEEMRSLFAEQGEAKATCEFCGKRYRLSGEELLALIRQVTELAPAGE